MSAESAPVMSAEELLRVDIPGKWTELVRGRLIVREPPGIYHGRVAAVGDWLDAGVSLVWVIDPQRREAHIHRADGTLDIVRDALHGEDVLPGFTCSLMELLD